MINIPQELQDLNKIEIDEKEKQYIEAFGKKLSEFELKKARTYRENPTNSTMSSQVGMEFPKEIFVLGKASKAKQSGQQNDGENSAEEKKTNAEGDNSAEPTDAEGKSDNGQQAPAKPKKVYKINNEETLPQNMSK